MTAREETIVLRDAAAVYAEGVCFGLRAALMARGRGQFVTQLLEEWETRLQVAEQRERSSAGGGL